jgi:uncharacterized protein (DUF2235 family)
MSRRIIILSDGTGNSASAVWRTNVWRVFESLDLSKSDQVAFYDDGVGTSSFKPLAILGGAFGYGLKRNVIDIYKFVCRNYRSSDDYEELDTKRRVAAGEPIETVEADKKRPDYVRLAGDDIYGFGFSRGSFTIRVVIGLIDDQGLVRYASEQELDTKAIAAYRAYRAKHFHSVTGIEGAFRWLRDLFVSTDHKDTERPVDKIRFLGLWDTVAAYGLPVDEWTRGISKWIWPLELPGRRLCGKVTRACHAVCLDDERQTFQPVLWDEEQQVDPAGDKWSTGDQRITQVWFAGVHSNVGGGYPDDALAKVSLTWMMNEAAAAGLNFKKPPRDGLNAVQQVASAEDKDGRLYDSRSGLGGYYRYGPRKVDELCNMVLSKNPEDKVRILLPKIHNSVFGRINVGAHLYAPIGLPKEYAVVSDDGVVTRRSAGAGETDNQRDNRVAGQDATWNLVWKRRVIYFITVFASLHLALYPFYRLTYPANELESQLRLVSDAIRLFGAFLPSGAKRWLDAYAQDPAWFLVSAAWVAILILFGSSLGSQITDRMRRIWNRQSSAQSAAHEDTTSQARTAGGAKVAHLLFLGLLLYVVLYPVFMMLGINWLTLPKDAHQNFVRYTAEPIYGLSLAYLVVYFFPERSIHWLRERGWYKWLLRFIKLGLAPFVFAVLTAWYGLAFTSHYLFDIRDGRGAFCTPSRGADYLPVCRNENFASCDSAKSSPNAAPAGLACFAACKSQTFTIDFGSSNSLLDNGQLCHPTKILVERGGAYKISVKREPADGWSLWGKKSHLYGQPIVELDRWQRGVMLLLYPLRRSFDRPWGSIIARFGSTGNEESFMDADPVPVPDEDLSETMHPKRDGELYFYLNEPVVGIWRLESVFANLIGNKGVARITVTKTN